MATTHAQELQDKWGSRFPRSELDVLAEAGYGKQIGLGKRPALLVVDATYSFCGAEPLPILDAIAQNRRSCGERAWAAIGPAQRVIAAARESGVPVIYSIMRDPSDHAYEPGLWGAKNARGIEDHGDAGPGRDNEVIDELTPAPGEIVYDKDKPSIFHGTGLIAYLVERGIDSLIICGGTTSGCVYASSVDGFSNNYKVTVVHDASFDRVETPHWAALLDIDMKYGDVADSESVIAQLRAAV